MSVYVRAEGVYVCVCVCVCVRERECIRVNVARVLVTLCQNSLR